MKKEIGKIGQRNFGESKRGEIAQDQEREDEIRKRGRKVASNVQEKGKKCSFVQSSAVSVSFTVL